jgi:rRNA maturation endonuclease Nob1
MKKLFVLSVSALLAGAMIVSCSKKQEEAPAADSDSVAVVVTDSAVVDTVAVDSVVVEEPKAEAKPAAKKAAKKEVKKEEPKKEEVKAVVEEVKQEAAPVVLSEFDQLKSEIATATTARQKQALKVKIDNSSLNARQKQTLKAQIQ